MSKHKDTLDIHPDKVGSVFGCRRATINAVQDKFKVKIYIDKNPNYNGKTTVPVSGNRCDVTKAIDNIKELIGELTDWTTHNKIAMVHTKNEAQQMEKLVCIETRPKHTNRKFQWARAEGGI